MCVTWDLVWDSSATLWPVTAELNLKASTYTCFYGNTHQFRGKTGFLYGGQASFVLVTKCTCMLYKEAGVSPERPLNKAIQVIILIVFGTQSNVLFILIHQEETKSKSWHGCVRSVSVLERGCFVVKLLWNTNFRRGVFWKQSECINVSLSTDVIVPFFNMFSTSNKCVCEQLCVRE